MKLFHLESELGPQAMRGNVTRPKEERIASFQNKTYPTSFGILPQNQWFYSHLSVFLLAGLSVVIHSQFNFMLSISYRMDAYVSFVFWMDVPYLKSGDNGSAQGLWQIPELK